MRELPRRPRAPLQTLICALALALAFAVSGVLGIWPPMPVEAAIISPFTPRFTTIDRGDIGIVGNTLLTCPSAQSGCAAAQNRTASGQQLDNNGWSMVAVDIDGDPSTPNSSSATYTLPAGGSVLWAGLYWGARSSSASRTSVRFKPPSGAYQTVSGALIGTFASAGYYQAFADVTSAVRAAGGGSYTVANVQAQNSGNRYAGWALVVVTRETGAPLRQLTIFDGFARTADTASDRTVNIPLSGLRTPPSGPVNARLGVVAYDGDANQPNDTLQLSSGASGTFTTLSSAAIRPPTSSTAQSRGSA